MDPSLEDRPPARSIRSVLPAVRFLAPYGWAVFGASVALIVTAGVTLSVGQGIRLIIDQGLAEGATPDLLVQSLAVFAGLVLVLAAGTFARFYLVSWVGERVSADIRVAVFSHVVHLHPAYFEAHAPSEIQSRLTTDTLLLQTVIGSSVSIALRNILMFIGGLVLMLITNPKLSLLVVASVPLVVLPIILFGRRVRRLSRESQDRIADVGSYVGETLRHLKTVQAFTHEAQDIERFGERVESALTVALRRIWQRAWLIAVVMVLVLSAIAVMLYVGGNDVIAGTSTAGELAAFIFYAFIVAGSVGAISEVISDLQRAAGATERLVELLRTPSELALDPNPASLPRATGAVALDSVCFSYPSRPDVAVLQGVSLRVEPGQTVALVGPSGAGKSTLFDLLLRFYDPTAGALYLDGIDIRRLALEALRSHIAIVSQQPALFTGSVLDNVRYGRPDASLEEVREACAVANALAFVEAMPAGFDTPLGEDGIGLSGGQRQRIAIARAVLRDPAVLLLDEATSALDAESERAVQEALDRIMVSRTTLVIAHRLATVRNADRILVMDAGRIRAEGDHASLLATDPMYARLAELQFVADGAGEVRLSA